jgi:small-conductance mechanosensitive channel
MVHRIRGGGRGLALAVVVWLAALAVAHAQEAAPSAAAPDGGTIAVASDAATDRAIATRVRAILDAIEVYDDVSVEVEAGVVRLGGSVASEADGAALTGLVERVDGVVTVTNDVQATRDVRLRLGPVVERIEYRLGQAVSLVPLVVVGLAVLAVVAALGLLMTASEWPWRRLGPNPFIGAIFRQLVRVVFLLVGVVAALDIMGATALLGTILGAAGIIGLAVGFGVRDTIENFVSSVMLSVRQPFRPNDLVEVDGELGHVIRLTSRATVLLTLDGNHVRIPNAVVFKSKIRNYTRAPSRRFTFDLGVDAASDLVRARAVGVEALDGLDFVLTDPPAGGWVEAVGDSNVVMRYVAWVDQSRTDYFVARGEAIRVTKLALESAGFALPEPIYNLNLRGTAAEGVAPPAPPPAPPPPAAPVQATAAVKDQIIERKVAAERDAGDGPDLLRVDAAQE